MVVGRNNGVVGLMGFSDKKMSGLLFGPQKSGRNNGVVIRRGFHCMRVVRVREKVFRNSGGFSFVDCTSVFAKSVLETSLSFTYIL